MEDQLPSRIRMSTQGTPPSSGVWAYSRMDTYFILYSHIRTTSYACKMGYVISSLLYTIARDRINSAGLFHCSDPNHQQCHVTESWKQVGGTSTRKTRKTRTQRRKQEIMIRASTILMVSRCLAKINWCLPRRGGAEEYGSMMHE